MDHDTEDDTKQKHKKKMLLKRLCEQMEFYFSDSNLNKDKYLQKLLDGNFSNYVMVSEFMRFNRIKQISGDVRDLLKAIEESTVLELSTDRASVRRKAPASSAPPQTDPDTRTIYVENVPSSATVEWILEVFGQYGSVLYVSMPKYKLSNRPKGFAFVELDSTESAYNALQEFSTIGHLINPNRTTPPMSFALYGKEEDDSSRGKDKKATKKDGPAAKSEAMEVQTEGNKVASENETNNIDHKDKAEMSDSSEDEETTEGGKKRKVNGVADGEPPAKMTKMGEVAETNVPFSPNLMKNQKKRQKKMEKINKKRELKNLGMHIMLKKEWKKFRNNHIDMARQKEKEEKKALRMQLKKAKAWKTDEDMKENETEEEKPSQEQQLIEAKNVGAAYLNPPPLVNKEPEEVVLEGLKYPKSVIVRIHTPAPIVSKKAFKRSVMSAAPVKYVNCQEGTSVAYVRCRSTEQAASFCANGQWMHMTILEGVEEAQYWQNNKRHHDTSSHHRGHGSSRRRDGGDKRHRHHHRRRHHHSKHKRYKDLDKPNDGNGSKAVGPTLPERSLPETVTLDDSEEDGECDLEKYMID